MNNCVNPSRKMTRLPNELRGTRSIGDFNKNNFSGVVRIKGLMGECSRENMGREVGGRSKREGICVYLWLIHVEV